jgi:meso-butanediol dehydrogenase / (S,S)-butanediol dehydrogenase / diacetyl reductase
MNQSDSSSQNSPIAEPKRRTAIVTGAGQGIGCGIALRLAQDGLAVTLNDLLTSLGALESACGEISRAGGICRIATGDVSVAKDVDSLVADHVAQFGSLDVMVANAGIAFAARFEDTTPESLDRTLAINVRGVFNCFKAASVQMIAQGRGGRLIAGGQSAPIRAASGSPPMSRRNSRFAVLLRRSRWS